MTNAAENDYLNPPSQVVSGLVDLVSTALLSKFPTLSADEQDIELVLDMLHLLRPSTAELAALDGVLYMARAHWDNAIRTLQEVTVSVPQFGHARALLAYSLSMKGDPEWKRYADEALEISPGRDTEYLVSALRARADLLQAIKVADSGGAFVVPNSVTELAAFNNKSPETGDEARPAATTNIVSDQDMMMRSFPRA